VHVSFLADPSNPTPVILPMIGQIGTYEHDEEPHCYLHGYVSSRIMRHGSNAEAGLPISLAATKLDGLVLSLTPNSHSYNYRSAVLQGSATVVEDVDGKVWAMHLVTNGVVEQRWENTRTPPDNVEMQSTRILKVKIESASAKVREGGPGDDKKDTDRGDVVSKTWTGVVPVYERLGAPIASNYNQVGKVPGYLKSYVDTQNEGAQRHANEAAMKVYGAGKKKADD